MSLAKGAHAKKTMQIQKISERDYDYYKLLNPYKPKTPVNITAL